MMAETARRSGQSADGNIPVLFLMAHMRLEIGDAVGAERCLQSAVKQLGRGQSCFDGSGGRGWTERSEGSPGVSGWCTPTPATHQSIADRALGQQAGMPAKSPYALRSRDWLILAIQSLLQDDLPSCLLWIHQADRRVFEPVTPYEFPQRLRLIGDLHAVLACVAVEAEELDEAERFLATAYQRHVQAEASQSVCRDLILTSRLAMLQGQSDRAQTLLDAAECQLVIALTPDDADRCPLMDIICGDRMQIAGTSRGRHDVDSRFSRFGGFENQFRPKSEEQSLCSRKIDDDRHNGASNGRRMP